MKQFTAILLAGIMSLTAAVPSFAAIQTNAADWARPSMEYAYQEGFLAETELMKATSPMSRLEFCKMAMSFLKAATGNEYTAVQASPFRDCQDPSVIAAYEAGIIGGVEPGVFAPEQTLTREQMAIMVARTLKVCGVALTEKAVKNPFTDTKILYDASNQCIDQLYGVKIISGYEDNSYQPFRKMTVQEAVTSFVNAHRYLTADGSGQKETEKIPEVVKPAEPEKTPETVKPVMPEKVPEAVKPAEPETVKPAEPEKAPETKPVVSVSAAETDYVTVGDQMVSLGMTVKELKAVWGEPDRVDESVYALERYIYLNDYIDYFFVTFKDGMIVEIFVPGMDFTYMGMQGGGTSADIRNLSYVSSAEHSGVVYNETSEARLPLDYEGKICGVLLQTKDFAKNKEHMSTLHHSMKEDMEAQLLDLIQVRRKQEGLPLLMLDKKLVDVARAHSKDMISEGYFDYNSPDGTTPFGRIMERGKKFLTASEIIARQRGNVVNVYQEWMRTAARHNGLMDSTMQEVGIGIASRTKILHVTVDLCGHGNQEK